MPVLDIPHDFIPVTIDKEFRSDIEEWCVQHIKSGWKVHSKGTSQTMHLKNTWSFVQNGEKITIPLVSHVVVMSYTVEIGDETEALHFKMRWL